MQSLLFKLSYTFMNFLGFMLDGEEGSTLPGWYGEIVEPIVKLLNSLLVPLLIIVGTAGSIYAVILGVNYARAETSDKREEAKKRMINAIVGLVIMVILLIILQLFVSNAEAIATWIQSLSKPVDLVD